MQRKDRYCWVCHRECGASQLYCETCPRVFHRNCTPTATDGQKYCPQCEHIRGKEDIENREERVEELADLLKFAVEVIAKEDKHHMFSSAMFDEDLKIVNEMDLSIISKRVHNREYVSTASFMADVKWIHHNCVILYYSDHEYAKSALKLLEVAKHECEEIETCADCYRNYHRMKDTDRNYFVETCRRPHAIVWAKFSTYPYWPAKVVNIDESEGRVDVCFFGDHETCWLPYKKCYLMSKSHPCSAPIADRRLQDAINEMKVHLNRLKTKYPNALQFYPKRTVFKPENLYLKSENTSADSEMFENEFRVRETDDNDNETEIEMETSSLSCASNSDECDARNTTNGDNICQNIREEQSTEINSEDSSDVQITQVIHNKQRSNCDNNNEYIQMETKEYDSRDSVLNDCNKTADVLKSERITKLIEERDEYFKQLSESKAENDNYFKQLIEITAERDHYKKKYRDLYMKTHIKE